MADDAIIKIKLEDETDTKGGGRKYAGHSSTPTSSQRTNARTQSGTQAMRASSKTGGRLTASTRSGGVTSLAKAAAVGGIAGGLASTFAGLVSKTLEPVSKLASTAVRSTQENAAAAGDYSPDIQGQKYMTDMLNVVHKQKLAMKYGKDVASNMRRQAYADRTFEDAGMNFSVEFNKFTSTVSALFADFLNAQSKAKDEKAGPTFADNAATTAKALAHVTGVVPLEQQNARIREEVKQANKMIDDVENFLGVKGIHARPVVKKGRGMNLDLNNDGSISILERGQVGWDLVNPFKNL